MGGTPFYQPDSPLNYMATTLGDVDTVNGNLMESSILAEPSAEPEIPIPPPTSSVSLTADDNENQLTPLSSDSGGAQSADASEHYFKDTNEDNHNNNHTHVTDTQPSPVPEPHSPTEQDTTAYPGTPPGVSTVSWH